MIILFDMDGVLLPQSEELFANHLPALSASNLKISNYVRDTLMNGVKTFVSQGDEGYVDALIAHIDDKSSDVNHTETLLRLIRSKDKAKLHLLSEAQSQIGNKVLLKTNWTQYFAEVHFGEQKLDNPKYYTEYITTKLSLDHNERVVIVEDSIYHVDNILKYLSTCTHSNIFIYFMLNPIYFTSADLYDEVVAKVHEFEKNTKVRVITKLYELVSDLFPLSFPPDEYLPFAFQSAPTPDELGKGHHLYKEIYNVPTWLHFDRLDEDSFEWVERREYFAIFGLLATDTSGHYNRLLMRLDFSTGHVKWLLPGGGLKTNQVSDYTDVLLDKIRWLLMDDQKSPVRNVYPVCMLTNVFVSPGKRLHFHHGIGWTGLITSSIVELKRLSQKVGSFENLFIPLSKASDFDIEQPPNRNVFKVISSVRPRNFPFEEEGNLYPIGKRLHQLTLKLIFRFIKVHKKYIKQKVQESTAFSFVDVSCGDDKDITYYVENSKVRVAVLNDVSPEAVMEMKEFIGKKRQKCPATSFFFTMQDTTQLDAYRSDLFDFVLCKNTLHHLPKRETKKKCLERIKGICRDCVLVMDIEHIDAEIRQSPKWKRPIIRMRHWWYMKVVGEAGPDGRDTSFLSFKDFEELIHGVFPNRLFSKEIRRIPTLRGTYMAAFISALSSSICKEQQEVSCGDVHKLFC